MPVTDGGARRNDVGRGRPVFSFGVLADVQYADRDPAIGRFYRAALGKLREAVAELNRGDLAFVVQLGDLVDGGWEAYDDALAALEDARAPVYHVPGNHDFDVAPERKGEVLCRLGLARGRYAFAVPGVAGWRGVVLDGTRLSTCAWPEGSPGHRAGQAEMERLAAAGAPNAKEYNGGIGAAQAAWLRGVLRDAADAGERVLVFCHFPVWPATAAYLCGHRHEGCTAERRGIHYLTFRGIVEAARENAFARVDVYPDRLHVEGYGLEPTRTLALG
jgi:3',5'-cyclic AMP phosphodiesterase CpdA